MSISSGLDTWFLPEGSTGALKKKSINYVFSKSDNGLVDIATVKDRRSREQKAQGGQLGGLLDGNYSCSGCGGSVVARIGSKNAHHFAHHSVTNCTGNPTTNLHNLAEEIIINLRSVYLPYLAIRRGDSDWLKVCSEDRNFVALQAFGEQTDNETKRVPDVVLKSGDYELIIEVAVTHFCDDEKKKKYKDAKKPSIEIDLSRVKRDISKADLTKLLMGDGCNPKNLFSWIYHPDYDAAVMAVELEEEEKRKEEIANQEAIRQRAEEEARRTALKAKEKAEKQKKYWRDQLKKSLILRAGSDKLTDTQQDLVWYHDVYKQQMRATDWKYKRSKLGDKCTYLDSILSQYAAQIVEENSIRAKENANKRLQWLNAALAKRVKSQPITDIQQDLIWHYEVVNKRMAAVDWKIKRNKLKARCYLLNKELSSYSHEIQAAEKEIERAKSQAKFEEEYKRTRIELQIKKRREAEIEAYEFKKLLSEKKKNQKLAKVRAEEEEKAEAERQAEKARLAKLCADSTAYHNRLVAEHLRRREAGLPYDLEEAKRAIARNKLAK